MSDKIDLGLLWLALLPCIQLLIYLLRDASFIWGLATCSLLPVVYAIIQRILSVFEIDNIEKRAVFITGCDTGFGNLLALKCLQRGMPVFAGCLTETGAASLRSAAVGFRGTLETLIVDVASDESVAKAATYLEQATLKYGGLHGVVNNAGIFGCSFFDDFLSIDQYKEIVEVNTFGVIRVTQALKPLVKKARQELRHFGVSVHIVEPGLFKTPITSEANIKSRLNEMWRRAPTAAKEEYGEGFLQKVCSQIVEGAEWGGSSRVDLVVDAYFHALTGRFPHLRYQIGLDCQFVILPLSYMPTGMRDAIFTIGGMLFNLPVAQPCARKDKAS